MCEIIMPYVCIYLWKRLMRKLKMSVAELSLLLQHAGECRKCVHKFFQFWSEAGGSVTVTSEDLLPSTVQLGTGYA